MDKIVLTGGGTAGHITPNIALIPYLSEYELHYIGQPDSMEQDMIYKSCPQVIFHPLECVKLQRKFSLQNFSVPFKLLASKKKAKKILSEIQPKAIFSKGGFVALPVMLAAGKIPLILHESDYTMGLANKLALNKCVHVCTSFASLATTVRHGVCTGAPLRKTIYTGDKVRAEFESGLKGRTNLLIMGGSLGAAAINEAVETTLNDLCKQFNVVHITGKNHTKEIQQPNYFRLPFTDKISDYFAWADYCVTRGGANALFELVALAIPALVIPLKKGISRGDQVDNAQYFEKLGCVKVLEQDLLSENPHALLTALNSLTADRQSLCKACRTANNIDGTETIATLIKEAAQRKAN